MSVKTFSTLIFVFVCAGSLVKAQPRNLLENPDADYGVQSWSGFGDASVDGVSEKNPHFVVRNGGYFFQDVELPVNSAGQFVLFIGRGASERVNADGAITGLPYLYGYMMRTVRPPGNDILDYLQGQQMRAQPRGENEWVVMWGVFEVPAGTTRVRFFLNQALRAGVPHNGSAARFDDLGIYLFATRDEAQAFVSQYR